MSRNAESHFSMLPGVDIERSKFKRPSNVKTTFNAGELIPIFIDEVLPGDTFSLDVSTLVRMSTPIFPTLDLAFLDTYFFYIPARLLWEHWKEFNGENSEGYWTQPIEYNIPQITSPNTIDGDIDGWQKGDLADYLGLPTKVPNISVSALPFRAYTLIWNEWFRDQNSMPPAYFSRSDSDVQGVSFAEMKLNGSTSFDDVLTNALYGAKPLPVSKYHDYFTSTLPAPQKGPAVDLPLYQDSIPVYTGPGRSNPPSNIPLSFNGVGLQDGSYSLGVFDSGQNDYHLSANPNNTTGIITDTSVGFVPNNLYADVSNVAVATISQLRQAFQLQKLFEKDARGGKNSLCLHVKKIAEKIWKAFLNWLIRGEGFSQPQRIGNVIIFPRGRDTFVKRYANLY